MTIDEEVLVTSCLKVPTRARKSVNKRSSIARWNVTVDSRNIDWARWCYTNLLLTADI